MKVLVTGGGGFIGTAMAKRLREEGHTVRTLARGDYPALTALGCEAVRADVADAAAVLRAADGVELVFHVAAKAGVWGPRDAYVQANVVGTQNVVDACLAAGVPKLVHTSSPSIAFAGKDLEGVDASMPLPPESAYVADYPRTKAVAERIVRAANSPALATVALRPHLVWGPGDNHLVPRIVARAKTGRLRIIGDGTAKIDATFIDNAAEAHLAAAKGLSHDGPVGGNAYFVSNGEPIAIGAMINRIVDAAGLPPVTGHIPFGVAHAVGAVSEFIYGALRIEREPFMTRFMAEQMATAHWFDISACARDFGWVPRVSMDEGMERLARSFRDGTFAVVH